MEVRNEKVIFRKAVDSEGRDSYTCKLFLPKRWVSRMGLNPDSREVTVSFDGDEIKVRRPEKSQIKHAPLASKERIRRFALVWAQMYANHKSTPFYFFEDSSFVGEGMADLGFEMDCGNSLEAAFPNSDALNDRAALERVLGEIDLQTLGNAIFSQWRWWNHWSMSPMQDGDFQWFVMAFSRLAGLAE